MARPTKDESEKLKKTVAFRITEGDFLAYQKKFGASGLSQSEFFREYVLTNTTQVISRPVASKDSKRAVFLLHKASNNINQLAHRANSENRAGFLDEGTFKSILEQLTRLNDFLISQTEESRK
jgi:hypothetical protein